MGNKRILIVEDDQALMQGIHLRLKANHYDTCFATDAITSISEARRCEPDLIILDLGLPAGDGFMVIERLKAIPSVAMIPIVVMSGREGFGNRERALRAGARCFLQKPTDDSELLAIIHQILGEKLQSSGYNLAWCRDVDSSAP
jgi:DNA-binding response OmpR family regulator